MAAPSWESKGADFSDTSAAPLFAIPVGAATGKIAVVSMFVNGGATTVTGVPTDFSIVPGTPVDASNHRLVKYWKRLAGADSGTYDFTLSASVFVEGAAELFTSCKASGSPFDLESDFAVDETNGLISPAVSIDTVGSDRLVLHSATCWSGGTWTPPVSYTKRINTPVGLITTSDKAQASTGSTGSLTAETTNADKRTAHVVALIGTTVAGGSMASISDEARANMLADRGLSDPRLETNVDLMKLVLDDGTQTLVAKTEATVAEHYNRYLISLRDS